MGKFLLDAESKKSQVWRDMERGSMAGIKGSPYSMRRGKRHRMGKKLKERKGKHRKQIREMFLYLCIYISQKYERLLELEGSVKFISI